MVKEKVRIDPNAMVEPDAARPPYGVGKDWKPTDNVDPDKVDFGKAVDKLFGVKTKPQAKKAARWRTLKDGRHVAISGTEKRGAMSARGETAMRTFERYASKKTIEVAACMTPAGETLFRQIGNKESVMFTPGQLRDMKDSVLTHNHPGPWGSFSASDVILAMDTNLAEARVVVRHPETGKRYLYRLTRPWMDSWGSSPAVINNKFNGLVDSLRRTNWPRIKSGEISAAAANFEVRDRAWQMIWGKNYSREEF